MGPLNDQMKQRLRETRGDLQVQIEWTTLAEYLHYLEKRGISSKRRLVHWRNHHSRARDRFGRQEGDTGATRSDARIGATRDGSRRARHQAHR